VSLFVAFSGGKDSTALAYRLAELGEPYTLLFTPTGNELPECIEHVHKTSEILGRELVLPPGPTLDQLIQEFNALPNFRMRWCTRMIKIAPCTAYLSARPGSTLAVGLRADEEERIGTYGSIAEYRYPLREWGWGLRNVQQYLDILGVRIPVRTDCALCYAQKTSEWYSLWLKHPEEYERGVQYEAATGHTFRTNKDSWPRSLADLRSAFERGRVPRLSLKVLEDIEANACRVCRF